MPLKETVTLEHPVTCENVELIVEFYYCPAERATWDCPGSPEEFEIVSVTDTAGNQYLDEAVWTDEQLIKEIQHAN